jgi:CRISPR system Cascade subunit CasE
MIISQIQIRTDICLKNKLTDDYAIHKFVYSLFPRTDNFNRTFLYRDKGVSYGKRILIILSENIPSCPNFVEFKSKEVPPNLFEYSYYNFSADLYPVVRKNGKEQRIEGIENIRSWFIKKAPNWGFQVVNDSLELSPIKINSFKSRDRKLVKQKVSFKCVIKVMDSSIFMKSFSKGIGRGRGFGFGLMEIIPFEY